MSSNDDRTVQLKDRHMQYLNEMAAKHGLADESKALRCLVDFAISETGEESAIFEETRCLDC